MKRSTSLSLLLMSSLSLTLSGCGDDRVPEEFRAFNSLGDCVRSGEFTMQQCQEMSAEAKKQTPKFASREECEKAFGVGACGSEQAAAPASNATQGATGLTQAPRESGGSSWMPLMAGFMMGRYMSGGSAMQGTQPLFRGPEQQPGQAGQPAGAGGSTYRTAGGQAVSTDAGGRVANPGTSVRQGFTQTAKPYTVRSSTTSRGGFGGSSSFGGSAGS